MCGENQPPAATCTASLGSSPRVRGKPAFATEIPYGLGLIPACAGKTRKGGVCGGRAGAHPRVCGENIETTVPTYTLRGSSPRVRGKRGRRCARGLGIRLIPACAGKTWLPIRQHLKGWAHPRVCGENAKVRAVVIRCLGSSPRVRGKLLHNQRQSRRLRLIPACAGKTTPKQLHSASHRAHPRVCGENLRRDVGDCFDKGSSPRVRGKRSEQVCQGLAFRLIPACAGKTQRAGLPGPGFPAHPRVCGENDTKFEGSWAEGGSSPRVRGKQWFDGTGSPTGRLIPACAGKTRELQRGPLVLSAHPRVCGENTKLARTMCAHHGSSPRVRGKLDLIQNRVMVAGLIPACAGKTPSPTSDLAP